VAEPVVYPRRFRRRLTIAFVLVAGLTSGLLAAGSYVMTKEGREQRFITRWTRQGEANLELDALNSAGADPEEVLDVYRQRIGFQTMTVTGSSLEASLPELSLDALPPDLRPPLAPGEVVRGDVTVAGTTYLAVGGVVEGTDTVLYSFFSWADLRSFLGDLRTVLLTGWVIVTALAALVGNAVARRTLRPVREASEAAHALAGGMLDTRLDTGRVDEFGAWARDFNTMASALEQKITELSEASERERRFTADVAHELRTPLTSVVAAASILEEDLSALPAASRRPLEVLVAELRRLRGLVDDLLELSRLDAGQEQVQIEEVSLPDLVVSVLGSYGWAGRVQVDAEPCAVGTDRRRVERVVANLVGNAVQYGDDPIVIRVRPGPPAATIEVSDCGPGIPAEDVQRVFDRFAKVDAARSSGGSGLGLAISRENATLLGGALEAVSRPGPGITFRLTIPWGVTAIDTQQLGSVLPTASSTRTNTP
jgi:two-component system sensor histidine kinase MtrB